MCVQVSSQIDCTAAAVILHYSKVSVGHTGRGLQLATEHATAQQQIAIALSHSEWEQSMQWIVDGWV